MKCQMCGKSEVNFHYSSSINGCVTETYLCSECAAKSGYDLGSLFGSGSLFDNVFPIFSGHNGLLPMAIPLMGYNAPLQAVVMPRIGAGMQNRACGCGCEPNSTEPPATEVDEDMKKRRELSMQMRKAAEDEDFEKAAELRDKLKEMDL